MIEAKAQARGQVTGGALLFDIDGTLANTDPLHLKAFNRCLGRAAMCSISALFEELQGFANASIGERFLPGETVERRAVILGEKEVVFRTCRRTDRAASGPDGAARPRGCRRHSHGRRDQRAASATRSCCSRVSASRTASGRL